MSRELLLMVSLVALLHGPVVSSFKLMCYYTNWAQYRKDGAKFLPEKIDPCLCTHLIFAFANITEDHELTSLESEDEEMYKRFNNLKKKNTNLKTLLSIGGWSFGTIRFTNMVATTGTRATFIRSAVSFLRQFGFDGLDLDWQFPGFRDSPTEDRNRFTMLLMELRAAIEGEEETGDNGRLLLTAAVAAYKEVIDSAYNISAISQYLDFISVRTFDFHGHWEKVTGHNSPLFQGPTDKGKFIFYNIDFALNYWRERGAAVEKLLVGFPTYGRTFTLSSSGNGVGAPVTGAGQVGLFTREPGLVAYYETCVFLKSATSKVIAEQQVPYAFKGNQWIGYDNQQSYKIKAQWLMNNHFGGAMLWSLDFDDFSGTRCKEGVYPLINTLKTLLNINGCQPPAPTGVSSISLHINTSNIPVITFSREVDAVDWCRGKSPGMFADPIDRSKYYICASGTTRHEMCPQELIFDENCHCCNWP
ncbi:acidic mammalian chitinase-like [Rhinoraja longicauda]